MSGLMRNVIDQVLRNMGEDERARSVEYVTDRMIEKMTNQERVSLLLAIIDRVMSNLSAAERADLSSQLTQVVGHQISQPTPAGQDTASFTIDDSTDQPEPTQDEDERRLVDEPPGVRERD